MTADQRTHPSRLPWRLLRLTILCVLLWGILAQGQGWGFGVVAIVCAVAAGLLGGGRRPDLGLQARGLVIFTGYFLKESVFSGLDVARRAFAPRLPLDLTWLEYPLRLPPGPARLLFVNSISLLPGTLSADLDDDNDQVTIHSLAGEPWDSLQRLERRIAGLFGIPLDHQEPPS